MAQIDYEITGLEVGVGGYDVTLSFNVDGKKMETVAFVCQAQAEAYDRDQFEASYMGSVASAFEHLKNAHY